MSGFITDRLWSRKLRNNTCLIVEFQNNNDFICIQKYEYKLLRYVKAHDCLHNFACRQNRISPFLYEQNSSTNYTY